MLECLLGAHSRYSCLRFCSYLPPHLPGIRELGWELDEWWTSDLFLELHHGHELHGDRGLVLYLNWNPRTFKNQDYLIEFVKSTDGGCIREIHQRQKYFIARSCPKLGVEFLKFHLSRYSNEPSTDGCNAHYSQSGQQCGEYALNLFQDALELHRQFPGAPSSARCMCGSNVLKMAHPKVC